MPRRFRIGWRIPRRRPMRSVRWESRRILPWSPGTPRPRCLVCRATAWWIGQQRRCHFCKKKFRRSIRGSLSGDAGSVVRRGFESGSLFHRDTLNFEASAHQQRAGANERAGGKRAPKKCAVDLVECSEEREVRTVDGQRDDILQGKVGAGERVADAFEKQLCFALGIFRNFHRTCFKTNVAGEVERIAGDDGVAERHVAETSGCGNELTLFRGGHGFLLKIFPC